MGYLGPGPLLLGMSFCPQDWAILNWGAADTDLPWPNGCLSVHEGWVLTRVLNLYGAFLLMLSLAVKGREKEGDYYFCPLGTNITILGSV